MNNDMSDIRKQFESAVTKAHHGAQNFNKDDAGHYLNHSIDNMWWAWQSARSQIPNEHGKNRYGLDMAYFRSLFNRELLRPLVDFKPDELARVLARAARAADDSVLQEPEFQSARVQGSESLAESVASAIRELLRDFYACTRVWEAWSVGTMTEDDFEPAEETELADDIARTVLKIYTQPPSAVIDWQDIHKMAGEYVEGYEFRGGAGDYRPTDKERHLIMDAVAGLMHEVQQEITSATQSSGVPEGWSLVPVTPTSAMQRAWDRAPTHECNDQEFIGAYQAMLDAVPSPDKKKPLCRMCGGYDVYGDCPSNGRHIDLEKNDE